MHTVQIRTSPRAKSSEWRSSLQCCCHPSVVRVRPCVGCGTVYDKRRRIRPSPDSRDERVFATSPTECPLSRLCAHVFVVQVSELLRTWRKSKKLRGDSSTRPLTLRYGVLHKRASEIGGCDNRDIIIHNLYGTRFTSRCEKLLQLSRCVSCGVGVQSIVAVFDVFMFVSCSYSRCSCCRLTVLVVWSAAIVVRIEKLHS